MNKLYIIVRNDLAPGMQIPQSTHAAIAFALQYTEHVRSWNFDSNNLIALQVPDEAALLALRKRICGPCVEFREPDFDNELTALTCSDSDSAVLSSLPLALRAPKAAKAAA